MNNCQNKTLPIDLFTYFDQPSSPRQRQYEAIRAIVVDHKPITIVAKKYNYKLSTMYSLLRDVKSGKINLFPVISKKPRQKKISPELHQFILELRKKNNSITDIQNSLLDKDIRLSEKTIERLVKQAGFARLKRRSKNERPI